MSSNYSLYKPLSKADAGAALQFKYAPDINCLFIEACRQKGQKLDIGSKDQFDWANKITFKLNLTDIGQLLLVFGGKKPSSDLIHKSEKDGIERTSILKLAKQSKDTDGKGFDNYALRLNKTEYKNGEKLQSIATQIYIDHHEAMIIGILLRKSVEKLLELDR